MSLRTTLLERSFRRPAGYFGREWNRMAPRERRLVGGAGRARWWRCWWRWWPC